MDIEAIKRVVRDYTHVVTSASGERDESPVDIRRDAFRVLRRWKERGDGLGNAVRHMRSLAASAMESDR